MPDVARKPTRRVLLRGIAGGVLTALAGCATGDGSEGSAPDSPTSSRDRATDSAVTDQASTPADSGSPAEGSAWRGTELTDVRTGEPFTVQEFAGQPVLLEFFAVWCPVCTAQQKVLRDVADRRDDLVVVSLNTDPNEDAARVEEHLDSHDGFDWRFAIAPTSMTKSLVAEFGSVIANPPAAPVVRVCPDGAASLVSGNGVKSADKLVAAIEQC